MADSCHLDVALEQVDTILCQMYGDFWLNPKSLRFIQTYYRGPGYIDGVDSPKTDTPYISLGTCQKL